MSFLAFINARIGQNWVVARRSPAMIARYGEDVVCLSKARYDEIAEAYERETGLAAHGFPGQPCKRLADASLRLRDTLRDLLAEIESGKPGDTRQARALLEELGEIIPRKFLNGAKVSAFPYSEAAT